MAQSLYYAGEVALWLQRECGDALEFLGCHNLTGVAVPRGEKAPSYCRVGKNKFAIKRTVRGVPGLGAVTIVAYDTVLNTLQELACAFNLYVLHSACGADEDPTNYDYLYIYQGVEVTAEQTDTHVVGISAETQTPIMLSMPATFTQRLKVKSLTAVERDVSAIVTTEDLMSVAVCDEAECGTLCGNQSQGCQKWWMAGSAGMLIKSTDGGGSFSQVTSPFTDTAQTIKKVICDDDLVLLLNGVDTAYAYSWDAGATWTEVLTPTQLLNDACILGSTRIWMVGQNGYVYFSNNRGQSVSVQDAGVATTKSLNSVSFADTLRGYSCGDDNSFIRTVDGGNIWEAVTGPSSAVNDDLYKVVAIPGTEVVLCSDESGNLYRSENGGDSWSTVFTATTATAGGIPGIAACDCNVIAFVANDEDPYFYSGASVDGVMYQSIDGGNTWKSVELPANDGLRDIVCCDVNQYIVVGENGYVAYVAGQVA